MVKMFNILLSFSAQQVLPPKSGQPADKDVLQHEVQELKHKGLALDQEIAQIKAECVFISVSHTTRHLFQIVWLGNRNFTAAISSGGKLS